MSVERIRKAILDEARAEADRIAHEARLRYQERLDQARRSIQEEFDLRWKTAQRDAEREASSALMQKRSEHNMALLRRRNAILDELFQQAARRLVQSPDEGYRELVRGWMRDIPPHVAGQVLCNGQDGQRLGPLVDSLNRSRGPQAQLRLVPGDRPSLGGVIFQTDKFEIDLSLDARLARLREELAPQVADILLRDQTGV